MFTFRNTESPVNGDTHTSASGEHDHHQQHSQNYHIFHGAHEEVYEYDPEFEFDAPQWIDIATDDPSVLRPDFELWFSKIHLTHENPNGTDPALPLITPPKDRRIGTPPFRDGGRYTTNIGHSSHQETQHKPRVYEKTPRKATAATSFSHNTSATTTVSTSRVVRESVPHRNITPQNQQIIYGKGSTNGETSSSFGVSSHPHHGTAYRSRVITEEHERPPKAAQTPRVVHEPAYSHRDLVVDDISDADEDENRAPIDNNGQDAGDDSDGIDNELDQDEQELALLAARHNVAIGAPQGNDELLLALLEHNQRVGKASHDEMARHQQISHQVSSHHHNTETSTTARGSSHYSNVSTVDNHQCHRQSAAHESQTTYNSSRFQQLVYTEESEVIYAQQLVDEAHHYTDTEPDLPEVDDLSDEDDFMKVVLQHNSRLQQTKTDEDNTYTYSHNTQTAQEYDGLSAVNVSGTRTGIRPTPSYAKPVSVRTTQRTQPLPSSSSRTNNPQQVRVSAQTIKKPRDNAVFDENSLEDALVQHNNRIKNERAAKVANVNAHKQDTYKATMDASAVLSRSNTNAYTHSSTARSVSVSAPKTAHVSHTARSIRPTPNTTKRVGSVSRTVDSALDAHLNQKLQKHSTSRGAASTATNTLNRTHTKVWSESGADPSTLSSRGSKPTVSRPALRDTSNKPTTVVKNRRTFGTKLNEQTKANSQVDDDIKSLIDMHNGRFRR